jgi:hypothetical protein
MNEIYRRRDVHEPPLDEPHYCSVLDRDPRWTAASTVVPASRRGSRLTLATSLLVAGAAFAGGLSAGSFLALTVGAEARPRPGRSEVWMFPYPAIGGPARPGDALIPTATSEKSVPGWIETPNEPVTDVTAPQPGARLRGESR